MSKFNKKLTQYQKLFDRQDAIVNEAGGLGFRTNHKEELLLRTMTNLVGEDKYYKDGDEDADQFIELVHTVSKNDPLFVMKLAKFARTEMYLRSVPTVLLTECALSKGNINVPNSRQYVTDTIQRADEITEMVAYAITRAQMENGGKKRFPLMIKNGVADAFNKFDEYQFAKYNRRGEVTLKDAVNICHPNPNNKEQSLLIKKILDGTLKTPDTWEVATAVHGVSKSTWETVIPAMGYMALMRNLSNFLKHGVDITPVLAVLGDAQKIKNSKQFPFRFYTAAQTVESKMSSYKNEADAQAVVDCLNDAVITSIANIPKLTGTTAILIDQSASMHSHTSRNSIVRMCDISALFGGLAKHICEKSIVIPFGNTYQTITLPKDVFSAADKIKTTDVGHSTNAYLPIEHLIKTKTHVDRVVLFSDMQCWNSASYFADEDFAPSFSNYRRNVNPNATLYSFDLSGYGHVIVPPDTTNVALVPGWSDRVFAFMSMFEQDRKTMVQYIEENY